MTEALAEVIERLEATVGTARDPRGRAFAPIAELLRSDGRLVEARVRVEAGTEVHPDFASGHMVAARIYADLALDDLARTATDRVLALDPANEEAAALGAALGSADEESALEWARAQGEAPVVEPADGELLTMTMGDIYLSQGAPQRAVALFQRMVADDPENEALRLRLERAQRSLEQQGEDKIHPEAPGEPMADEEEAEPVLVEHLVPSAPVPVESLAPVETVALPLETVAVPVIDLGPDAVPVHELAPHIVGVQSLAPDRLAADGAPDGDVDDFMAWLNDQ